MNLDKQGHAWILISCLAIMLMGAALFMVNYHNQREIISSIRILNAGLSIVSSDLTKLELEVKENNLDESFTQVQIENMDSKLDLGGARIDSINQMVLSMKKFHVIQELSHEGAVKVIDGVEVFERNN